MRLLLPRRKPVIDQPPNLHLFDVLAITPALVRQLVQGISTEAAEAPVDEGWSAKDVVAHLIDTDGVIGGRIRRIVEEDRPFIRSIDPPARLEQGGYRGRALSDLLAEFDTVRVASLRMLHSLSPAQLARVGDHDEAGEISAADLAHQWAFHDLMHVQQICKILQLPLLSGMGNTRRFYSEC